MAVGFQDLAVLSNGASSASTSARCPGEVYADMTRRPLSLIASEQGPALGSAIHAAVAAGRYPDLPAAAAAMGGRRKAVYLPDADRAHAYDRPYAEYLLLHDHFGRGGNEVMHRLRNQRDRRTRS
jgi:L-ribulokinase